MAVMTEAVRLPVCVGVDVGQIRDSTAIAVAEVSQVQTGKFRTGEQYRKPAYVDAQYQFHAAVDAEEVMKSEYTIRHIRRLPLATSYPNVALHLADMLCSELFAQRNMRVLIDVTGVGRPVYDDLKEEINLRKEVRYTHNTYESGLVWKSGAYTVQLKPITFSHGEKYNRSTGVLAKAYLVSRLQSLLQSTRVHAPDTAEVRVMLEELRVYEIKVDDDGKDTYGAKIGKHDDLATALALACLEDPFADKVTYSGRVY